MDGFMTKKLQIIFGLMLVFLHPALSQADDAAAAKEKIEEGKRLIAEEKYQDALEAFESSYALRPKTWVLFNIAMCNKALHRYTDAISAFKQFLETESDPSSTTGRLARASLSELERLVGKVRLVEAPKGAAVYIDGERVGTAPLKEPLALDPGRHVVRVSKDRFKSLDVEVIVASGSEVEVRADLEQPKAELKVACSGEKTVVFVDEASVGPCPYQGSVEAGVHEVKVIEPGKETFIQTVEASAGSTLVIAVDLKPVIVIKPPTFISDPTVDPKPRGPLALQTAGIITVGGGVVGLIIGGIFSAKWNSQYDTVQRTTEETNNLNHPDSYDEWQNSHNEWESQKSDAESYRRGAAAGYAVGGGLVAVGAALWIVGTVKHKKSEQSSVLWKPSARGVTFEF